MFQTARLVFGSARYAIISAGIFIPMTFGLLLISEYIFLEPYIVSHLPPATVFSV